MQTTYLYVDDDKPVDDVLYAQVEQLLANPHCGARVSSQQELKGILLTPNGVIGALFVDQTDFDFTVFVDPNQQGKGFGRRLLNEAMAEFSALELDAHEPPNIQIRALHPAVRKILYKASFFPEHHRVNDIDNVNMVYNPNGKRSAFKAVSRLLQDAHGSPKNGFVTKNSPYLSPLLLDVSLGDFLTSIERALTGQPITHKAMQILTHYALSMPRNLWGREILLLSLDNQRDAPLGLPHDHSDALASLIQFDGENTLAIFGEIARQGQPDTYDSDIEQLQIHLHNALKNGGLPGNSDMAVKVRIMVDRLPMLAHVKSQMNVFLAHNIHLSDAQTPLIKNGHTQAPRTQHGTKISPIRPI